MTEKPKRRRKRTYINRMNDLDNNTWLLFQKSWFIHNPPPRRKDILCHPAKFPETLAQVYEGLKALICPRLTLPLWLKT